MRLALVFHFSSCRAVHPQQMGRRNTGSLWHTALFQQVGHAHRELFTGHTSVIPGVPKPLPVTFLLDKCLQGKMNTWH